MNKYIKEVAYPFMDKAEVRIYELVGLVISAMMASIGSTTTLLYYGNEITELYGWKPFFPFVVSNIDDGTKITALVMCVVGIVICSSLMQVMLSRKSRSSNKVGGIK
jgi:hypothetical protein